MRRGGAGVRRARRSSSQQPPVPLRHGRRAARPRSLHLDRIGRQENDFMVSVTQLGYVGFEIGDCGAWERFACEVLGLELAERRPDGSLVLRVDEYAQRIVLHPGPADDLAYAGWELSNPAALESLAEQLRAGGVRVREGTREEAALRAVDRIFVTEDPSGARVELYTGPSIADRPFHSKHVAAGF